MTTTHSSGSATYSWSADERLSTQERITSNKTLIGASVFAGIALVLWAGVKIADWGMVPVIATGALSAWLTYRALFFRTPLGERRFRSSPKHAAAKKVWGQPGDGLEDAVAKFGWDRVKAGIKGEELTAHRLEALLNIPGVRIFHGMDHPAFPKADVDHIVVCGDRVALLDSKLYSAAFVGWTSQGEFARRNDRGELIDAPKPSVMPAAIEGYKSLLGTSKVRGFIVIHQARSRTAAQKLNTQPIYNGNLRIGRANDVVEELGQWLLEGKVGVVNRRTIGTLSAMKR